MTKIGTTETENIEVILDNYEALESLDCEKLTEFYHDDACIYSIDDISRAIEGRDAIMDFLNGFFTTAQDLRIERLTEPHVLGDLVLVRHVDHYRLDGKQHHDQWASVILVESGKIRKCFAHRE